MKNKKGMLFADLIIWIAMAFIIILLLGLASYVMRNTYTNMNKISKNMPTKLFNMTDINEKTFGVINDTTKTFRLLSWVLMVGMIFMIFISSFFVREHPALFIFNVLGIILAVIASVFISNQVEKFVTNPTFGANIAEMSEMTYMMLHLPVIVTIVGFFGMIFLLWSYNQDPYAGGGF